MAQFQIKVPVIRYYSFNIEADSLEDTTLQSKI